jgi:Histidine kinase-, DNA gyrase B-, and HSP90-like ATPase
MNITNIDKGKTVYFSTSAQAVRRWGRESISDPIVALLELVKNSYDADADLCNIVFDNVRIKEKGRIVIKDNGTGMTEEDILKKWLRAATNNKSLSKETKKHKRRKIGEKGIGRFATERLAKKVTLISRPENLSVGYVLEIDWSEYDDPDADFEKVPLRLNSFTKPKKEHGLELVLECLDESWDEKNIENMNTEISLMIPPTDKKGKFEVKVQASEFPKYEGKIKSNFLNGADFMLNARLEKDGKITYTIKKRGRKPVKREDKMGKFLSGPLEFQLFFFYLGQTDYLTKKDNATIDFSLRKNIMSQFSGIKLYRDGFRVKPFGDPSNDWLDLNVERVNNPTLFPGKKQIFGVVKISKDDNKYIEDTTSRENVIANLAWGDLKRFVKGALKCFTIERQKLERKYKGSCSRKKKTKEKNPIKESFKKGTASIPDDEKKDEILIPFIPQDIIDICPKSLKGIIDEFNGCLLNRYFNAASILARKILDISTILKFKGEGKHGLILKDREYIELGGRIEILKSQKMIDSPLAKRLIGDNKIKLFGDSAAHSYRINVREEDMGPIRDLLRMCLEQLFFDCK